MFDFLDTKNVQNVVAAGHHSIQYIRQWATAVGKQLPADTMPLDRTSIDLTPGQTELAHRIIQEIESLEQKPVIELSPSKIDEYIRHLSNRIEQVAGKQLGADREKGRDLLDKLRSSKW